MPKSRVSQTTVFGAQRPLLRTNHHRASRGMIVEASEVTDMDLYLMQHGQATTETEDPEREKCVAVSVERGEHLLGTVEALPPVAAHSAVDNSAPKRVDVTAKYAQRRRRIVQIARAKATGVSCGNARRARRAS